MTDLDAIVEAVVEAMAPYVERAVQTAVHEAGRRAAQQAPLVGTLASIEGATGIVAVPNQVEQVPCTLVYLGPAVGHRVVVVFYGRGIAYGHGPIAGQV